MQRSGGNKKSDIVDVDSKDSKDDQEDEADETGTLVKREEVRSCWSCLQYLSGSFNAFLSSSLLISTDEGYNECVPCCTSARWLF